MATMPPIAAPVLPDTTDPAHYALGRSAAEARRLMLQHRIYGPATRQLLTEAGITTGMRVLDVGSGAGDVALLLADLVGPTGEVVGVEVAPESIALATARAQAEAPATPVRFVAADLRELDLDEGPFDAVVGRWVLMYQPDPVALLRRLAALVRPGGVVAFQESDLVAVHRPYPEAPLHEQVLAWMRPPVDTGVEMRMGPRLFGAFVAAGLPAPTVRIDTPVGGGPEWPGHEYVAATMRSLLPMLVAVGGVDPDEVGLDTLADRLRDEVVARDGIQPLASVYGAWARLT
jgi:SAM-dependent methyltransferase